MSKEYCSLRTDGIHDGANIIHPLFERGAPDTLSDNPWPLLSNVTTRANFERRRKKAVYSRISCRNST